MKLKTLLEEAEFGDLLFNALRDYHKGNKEPDTKEEARYFELLKRFVRGTFNRTQKDPEFESAVKELMKMKKDFPKELIYKGNNELYRGVHNLNMKSITKKDLENAVPFNSEPNPIMSIPYIYKPTYKIQSWTPTYQVARKFGISVLVAKIPDSQLLFNHKFLNFVAAYIGNNKENEVIRVGGKLKCELAITNHQWVRLKSLRGAE